MTSRDLKGQTRDPNTLRALEPPISRKQLEMLFSNNRELLGRLLSAILATAWLRVLYMGHAA